MMGMSNGAPLKFVKRFAELRVTMVKAVTEYNQEVRDEAFPAAEHEFTEPAK